MTDRVFPTGLKRHLRMFAFGLLIAGVFVPPAAAETETASSGFAKHQLLAETLGKIDRIAEGCKALDRDEGAIDQAAAALATTRDELLETYRSQYQAGYSGMARIFELQDEKIVCEAAEGVYGSRGTFPSSFLIER